VRSPHRWLLLVAATSLVAATAVIVTPGAATAALDGQTGTGAGTSKTVNAAAIAASQPSIRPSTGLDRSASAGASLPVVPNTTARPAPPAPTGGGANSTTHLAAIPAVAPPTVASFDGVDQAAACGSCQPADVNAAAGVSEIAEMVNQRLRVFTKTGAVNCDLNLNSFLGTSDALSKARIQYDNVGGHYSFIASVLPASTSDVPALWVGATSDDEACGLWRVTRFTFTGTAFPAGTQLSFPILGQDRNALLVSTDNLTPTGENFTVFGISKTAIYSGGSTSFPAFATASRMAPVTNGGIPMISTSASYFIGSIPGLGYRVYRMTGAGGSSPSLVQLGTVSVPFSAPTRRVNQPGTSATLDPGDGRITSSPISDGSFIWFAHGISASGFPTVRYGALFIPTGDTSVAEAYHSSTSDDFNPSVGVSISPGGGNYIFVNWAYTETSTGTATSMSIDSVTPGAGVPNLIGTGNTILHGAISSQTAFGSFSSSVIDPTVSAGSCAVVAQEYFASGGSWRTRIVRTGRC